MSLITFSNGVFADADDVNANFTYVEGIAGGSLAGQFAQDTDTTAGLVFGYAAGNFRNDNTITAIAAGTVTLTDDTTNYVEVAAAGVTTNTTGFTSGKTPLFVATTADGAITTVVDKRAVAFMSNAPGDMTKAVYDTDSDGIVDAAAAAPWDGITDKPTSFTPSAHASSHAISGADEIAVDTSQITTGTMAVARLPVMGGASSIAGGTAGAVPAPAAGDDQKVLYGDGTYRVAPGADGTVSSVNTRTGDVELDSSDVGLDNVDNTADADKPISDLTQAALDAKQDEFGIQTANRIFSGPSSGSAAAPTFRSLVPADLPTGISAANIADASISNTEFQYLNGVTSNIQDQIDGISGGATAIDDLSDVTITTPTTDQVLTYNGTAWVNDDATGGASAIDDLTDVVITSATTGQVLTFDGTDWVNDDATGGTALSISSITSSATPSVDVDTYNWLEITALAEDATFAAPTGTPTNGQMLGYRITDDGTARLLTWNSIFNGANNNNLPETTTISEALYLLYRYNGATSEWDLIASPAGQDGADGADGTNGTNGTNGTDGAGYGGTSTTSLTIGTGSKAFTTQAGLAYIAGSRVRAISDANSANWMEGDVASYSSTTLTLTVDVVGGSGTLADWSFTIAGEKGADGADGTGTTISVSDGTTTTSSVDTIEFSGATVTDNSDGSVTVAVTGGGSSVTLNAQTTMFTQVFS